MIQKKFGLNESVIEKLNKVFEKYSSIDHVIIYGSRAKGNFKEGSDIDLTLVGDQISTDELLKIENEIDDLLLPYKVDLSILKQINNPSLLDHIKRIGKKFESTK